MIYLFISILALIIGILVVTRRQETHQSQLSECSICHNMFYDKDIFIEDDMPFCSNHRSVYLNTNWVVFDRVFSTEYNSENGVKLYEFKLSLWTNHQIPSFIKANYQVLGEGIRTEISLLVPKEKLERVKSLFTS
jgi:hypothetical protein